MTLKRLASRVTLPLAWGVVPAAATDIADNPLAVTASSESNIM